MLSCRAGGGSSTTLARSLARRWRWRLCRRWTILSISSATRRHARFKSWVSIHQHPQQIWRTEQGGLKRSMFSMSLRRSKISCGRCLYCCCVSSSARRTARSFNRSRLVSPAPRIASFFSLSRPFTLNFQVVPTQQQNLIEHVPIAACSSAASTSGLGGVCRVFFIVTTIQHLRRTRHQRLDVIVQCDG